MQLVVPMAGLGQRFVDAGYRLPKPLVMVDGAPMVARAIEELLPCDRKVFIVHGEHVARHGIDCQLRRRFPGCTVIVTPGLTAGQACTVRLAASALDPDEPVLVAACDNSHLYDKHEFRRLAASGYDCLMWTYRNDARVMARPEAYGWVRVKGDSPDVDCVSCKQPISAAPMGDHAISGTFWFRTAGQMIAGIDRLIAADIRVNNEYYLDVVPNLLIAEGRRVGVFEVEKYIGWGTPHDLEDYCRWRAYFDGVAARGVVGDARNNKAA